MSNTNQTLSFDQLGLSSTVLSTLSSLGYESPTPIQQACIPLVLDGHDLIGQAQTGTGKTAAFTLPLLTDVDLEASEPQILVLAPTRELAIQVTEAAQSYSKAIPGFRVLSIYGGQDYKLQLKQLKRGVHMVVGTPGRVMDHMRRGTLNTSALQAFVLDEADEMLRMGFVDDVEWVLEHVNDDVQKVLFSATMPPPIKRIAKRFLHDPQIVEIENKMATASTVEQCHIEIDNKQKLEVLSQLIEVEPEVDGAIVFVRTKKASDELADKLRARGYAVAALNGDIAQKRREQIIAQMKAEQIDILVATDVVARGLDISRISHVFNYDIPYDAEAYVHRIGRTGRAGRTGKAILFINRREKRLLKSIEDQTQSRIPRIPPPDAASVAASKRDKFQSRVVERLNNELIEEYKPVIDNILNELHVDPADLAAALALWVSDDQPWKEPEVIQESRRSSRDGRQDRESRSRSKRRRAPEMERYRVAVGSSHGAGPGNILGAICQSSDLSKADVGGIELYDDHSIVDLPKDLSKEVLQTIQSARVFQYKLQAKKCTQSGSGKTRRSGGGDKPFGRSQKSRRSAPKNDAGSVKSKKKQGKAKPTKRKSKSN